MTSDADNLHVRHTSHEDINNIDVECYMGTSGLPLGVVRVNVDADVAELKTRLHERGWLPTRRFSIVIGSQVINPDDQYYRFTKSAEVRGQRFLVLNMIEVPDNVAPTRIRCCFQCGRPSALFGSRDSRTGWVGWCRICNWHWHYADAIIYHDWYRSMQRNHLQLKRRGELLRMVGSFLVEDSVLTDLRTGIAQSRLRQVRELSLLLRWKRILVYGGMVGPRLRDTVTGLVRPVDTCNEADGVLPSHLELINCFWKLQLSVGPHFPLNIVCSFLANSPLT